MITIEAIQNKIHLLGIDTFMTKKEVKMLPEILNNNEKLLYLTSGTLDSVNYLVVATDKRVLFLNKGLLSFKQLEFKIEKISLVSFKTGLIFGEITFYIGSEKKTISQCDKANVKKFSDWVNKAINNDLNDVDELSNYVKVSQTTIKPSLKKWQKTMLGLLMLLVLAIIFIPSDKTRSSSQLVLDTYNETIIRLELDGILYEKNLKISELNNVTNIYVYVSRNATLQFLVNKENNITDIILAASIINDLEHDKLIRKLIYIALGSMDSSLKKSDIDTIISQLDISRAFSDVLYTKSVSKNNKIYSVLKSDGDLYITSGINE